MSPEYFLAASFEFMMKFHPRDPRFDWSDVLKWKIGKQKCPEGTLPTVHPFFFVRANAAADLCGRSCLFTNIPDCYLLLHSEVQAS